MGQTGQVSQSLQLLHDWCVRPVPSFRGYDPLVIGGLNRMLGVCKPYCPNLTLLGALTMT